MTIQEERRQRSHCPQGHAYAGDNLIVRPKGGRSCRLCKRAWNREKRQKSSAPDVVMQYREYSRRSAKKRRLAGTHVRGSWQETDKLKTRARRMLKDRVQRKRIVKPDRCQRCWDPTPVQRLHGHHHDYARSFDVVWLCPRCHGEEHRKPAPVQAEH